MLARIWWGPWGYGPKLPANVNLARACQLWPHYTHSNAYTFIMQVQWMEEYCWSLSMLTLSGQKSFQYPLLPFSNYSCMKELFPQQLVFDNGPQFSSDEINTLHGCIKTRPNCFVWNRRDYENLSLVCTRKLPLWFRCKAAFCALVFMIHAWSWDDLKSCLWPTVVG